MCVILTVGTSVNGWWRQKGQTAVCSTNPCFNLEEFVLRRIKFLAVQIVTGVREPKCFGIRSDLLL